MARKKKRGFSRAKKMAIPVALAAPVVIAAWPGLQNLAKGDVKAAATSFQSSFASTSAVTTLLLPFAVGMIAHKVANKTGVNKIARKLTMGYLQV